MKRTMRLLYIAGPWRGETHREVELNINTAHTVGKVAAKRGWFPVMSHIEAANLGHISPDSLGDDNFYLQGAIELMLRCDAVLLCPGWEDTNEIPSLVDIAERASLPVYHSTCDLIDP